MKKGDIWFMDSTSKETIRNFFAVVAGVITGTAFFMLAGLILLLTQLSQVKGHGEETDFSKINNRFLVFVIFIIAIGGFIGGYISTRISTKKDWAHGAITGFVMAGLLAYITEFNFEAEAILYYITIIGSALLGTWLGIRWKNKNSI